MSRFTINTTTIEGVLEIERQPHTDERGRFERLYCIDEFRKIAEDRKIKQINRSITVGKGLVRGMHYQRPPHAEIKFIQCLRGAVFDVAVDLRRESPTFLQSYSTTLSAENNKTLMIPMGCAHGFQTLSDSAELIYFHTESYQPEAEAGINIYEPIINISWPLEIIGLSERDANFALIDENFAGLDI